MPTNIWGVAFYVFALFPGVAFVFAREGHRPAVKRSVLRETAAVVLVSAVCAAVLSVPVAVLALFWTPFNATLIRLAGGDATWIRENLSATIALAIVVISAATWLGYALGTERMDRLGLRRLWQAPIPRDTSAWTSMFSAAKDGQLVEVALTLKSGAWASGTLYTFDNDPDPHPHRVITLTQPSYRAEGSPDAVGLDGTDYLLIEAGEIELLQVTIKDVDIATEAPSAGAELPSPESTPLIEDAQGPAHTHDSDA